MCFVHVLNQKTYSSVTITLPGAKSKLKKYK